MPESLSALVQDAVREAVRQELQAFRETEIVPLKRAVEELNSKLNLNNNTSNKEAAPSPAPQPPHMSPLLPLQLPSPQLQPLSPQLPPSPSLLQRVGTKVVQTTSTLLHGVDDSEHGASPLSTPVEPSMGPVTVRRNSGVSRASKESSSNSNSGPDLSVPPALQQGIAAMRVTHRKTVPRSIVVDGNRGVVSWNTKPSSRLLIDRICEIYVGDEAKNYREELRISSEHALHWTTIIYQRPEETKLKALHLIIPHQDEFKLFVRSLYTLVKNRRELMSGLALAGQHFVNVQWRLSGSTEQRQLSFAEVLRMARQLHIHCAPEFIRTVFDSADSDRSGHLSFSEFREFVRLLKHRSDIEAVYEQYRIAEGGERLIMFFEQVQHEPLPDGVELPLRKPLSLEQFAQLLHPRMSLKSDPKTITRQLDLPINNYFISSSHNSYLMGRQIADGSSIESCIRALQDGCRCIELDCWDGPGKGSQKPIVYHGHSITRLTTSVVFADVIEAVHKYAFITSPYPLILSLEINCSESSQLQIVSILQTTLSGVLVTDKLPNTGNKLPSPEQLRHRILVKVKGCANSSSPESASSSGDESISTTSITKKRGGQQRIVPELADLGVYFSGHRFSNFSKTEPVNNVYSFSERTIKSICKDPARRQMLREYTRTHFARVYPAGFRLNSSNFNPIYFWRQGVQMVALNWQTFDLGMQINDAMFANRTGYVLKPASLREEAEPLNLQTEQRKQTLTLTIISAQQLPRPKHLKDNQPFCPYVVVNADGTGDGEEGIAPQWRTMAVFNNGFNPQFNHTIRFTISELDYPFVFLRLAVCAEGQPFALHTCRLSEMSRGFRHLPLVDLHGEHFLFSSLFIYTELS